MVVKAPAQHREFPANFDVPFLGFRAKDSVENHHGDKHEHYHGIEEREDRHYPCHGD